MDPVLRKQLGRFRKNRRGFYSFIILSVLFTLSLGSKWICNNLPIVMRYEGRFYFPIAKFYPASEFGETIATHLDYKRFQKTQKFNANGNFMIFPPIPFGQNEAVELDFPPPTEPTSTNWLGTDDRGRDLLTRLIYGFRNSMLFALGSWFLITFVAYLFGAVQGFTGGRVDFYGQRITEIWSALPVLYIIIFLMSVFPSSLLLLMIVWVAFSWIGLAAYVRAEVFRIRQIDFITASQALGASTPRILFRHVLPNALTPLLTFAPFIISASIGSLAALDYLGLGLPPPTASWGELLRQGKENLRSWWLVFYPFAALFATLLLLNFTGEALREAFDSKAQPT